MTSVKELTIITPIYNRSHMVEETINSITNQKYYSKVEYIIVSDGSDDFNQLKEIVDTKFKSKDIKLIEQYPNLGTCAAINTGVKYSKSEWIMCIDSDDVLNQGAIKSALELISRYSSYDFIYTPVKLMSGGISPTIFLSEHFNFNEYLKNVNENISHNHEKGLLVRRSTCIENPFPENFAYEDEFHLTLNKKYKGVFVDIILRIYNDSHNERLSEVKPRISKRRDLKRIHGQLIGLVNVVYKFGLRLAILSPTYFTSLCRKILRRALNLILGSIKLVKEKKC